MVDVKIRTGYSFRTAAGQVDDVISRLKEIGWQHAPICDRASTFGFVRWTKACKAAGLKPIYGVELAVTESVNAERPTVDYWSFYAIEELEPVHALLELATSQFRFEPLLSYEQAMAARGVVRITGHRPQLHAFTPDKLTYMALAPSSSQGLVAAGIKRKMRFIATSDNKYPRKEDHQFYELVIGRFANTQTYPQYILSDEEWKAALPHNVSPKMMTDALNARAAVEHMCKATLPTGKLLKPVRKKTLKVMCLEGAKKLKLKMTQEYTERLDRELTLIKEKKFEDYFYIIADVVQWARERMVVGPARGSSCGSLVCYLLQITTVDPIKYDLVFERFIDVNRNDLPDVDIDFSDQKRQDVFDYMAKKYGVERVARLGTVNMFKARSVIKTAGAIFQIPFSECDALADSIIERSKGDARALQGLEDTLKDTDRGKEFAAKYPEILVAARMEGHPSHYSQHAAGIILTDGPVRSYVAIDANTGGTQCDKKDAETLGLLKIDALGLTQLSIFEDTLELAGIKRTPHVLEDLPRDDKAAFDVLNNGHFAGVFQFNGDALQKITKQCKVESLEDIVSITALGRPGPLTSGGTVTWVERKNKRAPVTYPHKLFEPYLKATLGVVTYQEQVMQIGRNIGDLTWSDVTALRKAMSQSLGKEYFAKFGDPWKAAAVRKGIPMKQAEKIWDDLCAYGAWAFNRSHAVAYGLISYWCCWLKAHYPVEFAAATLTHTTDTVKQLLLLRELAAEGITYKPVDIDLSTDKWTVGTHKGKKMLIGPVQNVPGLGPKLTQQILSARARGEPLPERAQKLLTNATTKLDTLFPIRERIEKIMPDPSERQIYSTPVSIAEIPAETGFECMVFAVVDKINLRDENEQVHVDKRGGKIFTDGMTQSVIMHIRDDSGNMIAKVNRYDYKKHGAPIVERGRPGKVIYALKGSIWSANAFKMLQVKAVRFIGETE